MVWKLTSGFVAPLGGTAFHPFSKGLSVCLLVEGEEDRGIERTIAISKPRGKG